MSYTLFLEIVISKPSLLYTEISLFARAKLLGELKNI